MPLPLSLTIPPNTVRRGKVVRASAMIALILVLLFLSSATAQVSAQQPGEQPPVIDARVQTEIIDSVCVTLNRVYVFPDVAKKMEKHIRKQLKDGAYKDLNNTADFTRKLTEDLREISKDKHLWVRYFSTEDIARFIPDTLDKENERLRREEQLKQLRYENFGFVKAERLTGNVGYLRFDGFADAKEAGATAIAALNFLAYCDALIIDLRQNGGGSPSMIQLIYSYFFDETIHLNSFYVRETDSIQQFWTQEQVQGPRMSSVELYVLTSNRTFSAAEEFTYNMKNLKRGTIIGETTGGGAHPTDTHPFVELNVVMSCPFGRAINPISGTNWEGTGIEPHLQVPQDQALDVAHIEALKKLSEKATDEQIKQSLVWAIETKETLLHPVTVDEELLKTYVGVYGPRKITFEEGFLYYQRENGPRMKMVAMSNDTFCFAEVDYFRLKVNLDEQGNPVELVGLYDNGRTDVSPRDPVQP